jgi:hypothetical protein
MNDFVKQTLKRLVHECGESLYSDPNRLKGMLFDTCPSYRKEIIALISVVQESLIANIKSAKISEASISFLSDRLHNTTGIDKSLAVWAINTWALALDIIDTPINVQLQPGLNSRINDLEAKLKTANKKAQNSETMLTREQQVRAELTLQLQDQEQIATQAQGAIRDLQTKLAVAERKVLNSEIARGNEQAAIQAISSWNHYFMGLKGTTNEAAAHFVLKKLGLNLPGENVGEKFHEKFFDLVPEQERTEYFIKTILSAFDGYQLDRYQNILHHMTQLFQEHQQAIIKSEIQKAISGRGLFQKFSDYTRDANIIQRAKEMIRQ